MTALDGFDGLLDWSRLAPWIAQAPGLPGTGPVAAVRRIKGGAQNLLFELERADGTLLVLRRPGRHVRADSADGMVREAKVLTALGRTGVPHPALYASCPDADVIGVPFSVLAKVDGFSPSGDLPGQYGLDPAWRQALAFEMTDAAAALALVSPADVGLADLGRPDGWLERQVPRYHRIYQKLRADDPGYAAVEPPGVDQVAVWLEAHRPATARTGIVHGDLQFANVMMAHDEPRLAAVVDWEMASLGDPLLDLAWILTAWREPGDPPGSAPQLRPWDGFPGRAELVTRYAERTGHDVAAFDWYLALACFRLGALLEGSYARARAGKMDAATGQALHDYATWLLTKAGQVTLVGA